MSQPRRFAVLPGGVSSPILELHAKRHSQPRCWHQRILIDPEAWHVECGDCGLQLNPVALLMRYAQEETRLEHLRAVLEGMDGVVLRCRRCGETVHPGKEGRQ